MTPDNFCYWLQGFFEISGSNTLTEEQVIEIKKHLYNVFIHKCESITYDSDTNKFTVNGKNQYGYKDTTKEFGIDSYHDGVKLDTTEFSKLKSAKPEYPLVEHMEIGHSC